mmetsp:Transcript_35175/g.64227  ORF Transcript_35175/g.64227 Transcript_35175/m.64227 type:complete len:343 (-) Transcript_35175:146-1174(-)
MEWFLAAAIFTAVLVLFLVVRNARRRGGRLSELRIPYSASIPDMTEIQIPEAMKQQFLFWGGALAGVLSAAVTHQLDVLKTLRHVGRAAPDTFAGYWFGLPMGSFAQGERFAVTLVLNATLQKRLDKWEKKVQRRSGKAAVLISFLLSMLASGIGEFLSNPPVVVKNYQIAENVPISQACVELYDEGGSGRFFNGVGFGVLRKSLANAIVLQTMVPTKAVLRAVSPILLGASTAQSKTMLGFVAGSITGSIAEVLTNHPDQVKTLTQTGMPLLEALAVATSNPLRGALWAGIRKGVIRGINWGGLAMFTALFEYVYRAKKRMEKAASVDVERPVLVEAVVGA